MRYESSEPGDDLPLEDFSSEADLPAELAMLAQQLTDEATDLAEHYPATSTEHLRRYVATVETSATLMPHQHEQRRQSSRRIVAWATALSITAAVVIVAGLTWPMVQEIWQDQQRRAGIGPQGTQSTNDPSQAVAKVRSDDKLNPIATDISPLEESPAAFLQDVSGPELEGLFDLWEQQDSDHATVSI